MTNLNKLKGEILEKFDKVWILPNDWTASEKEPIYDLDKRKEEIKSYLSFSLDQMAEAAIGEEKRRRDNAYRERNCVVAALSKVFPSHLADHPKEDTTWEKDWRNIVYIGLPTGQVSWHLHDDDRWLFRHLEKREGNHWDGHTTEEKYNRLNRLKNQLEKK